MSVNLGSQQLSLTDRQTIRMESSSNSQSTMPVNLVSQQFSSTNRQAAQVDLLPRFQTTVHDNFGSQKLSSLDKHQAEARGQASVPVNLGAYSIQSVPLEPPLNVQTPLSAYLGLQQLSPTIGRPSGILPSLNVQTSMSINMGSKPSLSTNKRPARMEASPKFQTTMPVNLGSQHMLSGNKRPQMEPPPKVQTESFESVRLKLRESLAAALGMVSQQQSKTQIVETTSPSDTASIPKQADVGSQSGELHSITTNASPCETSAETLAFNEQCLKCDEGQGLSSDTGSNENTSDKMKVWKCDLQECQTKNVSLYDEVPFDNNSIIKDELLQGHGLYWASDVDGESSEAMQNHNPKRAKLAQEEVAGDNKGTALQNAETLATKIETELFRLFGRVNKKYKEKGRSLLFNLKDRNNPELIEQVLSGEIIPERLCSMTVEELASKELSQWRLAKAEELAQMVVLPDSDVDFRRLVKKTHKGEFQVEVEKDDGISVEVRFDSGVLSQIPRKANEQAQTQSKSNDKGQTLSKRNEPKAPEGLQSSEKACSGDQNLSGNLDTILHEKNDLMQEFMVDELKETEFLPSIVSLDEFMEGLDKEPPFEKLSMDIKQDIPSSAEKDSDATNPEMNPTSDSLVSEMNPVSDSLGPKSDPASKNPGSKLDSSQDSLASKLDPSDTFSENPADIAPYNTSKVDEKYTRTDSNLKSGSVHAQSDTFLADIASKTEIFWEGLIQLNISALATVVGFFRSGEKTSTQEWPCFIEIKGRVRLDAFEKFLQELPLSRSRAIMISQFCWKEGSPEIGRLHLCETVDSYVADERVGFAEPGPGVELYFCPPHPKTTEMLGRHLPKEHTEGLPSAVNGLIGVIVWRRPVTVSPRLSSHHKHKKQLSSRKQQDVNPNSISSSCMPPLPSAAPPTNPQPPSEDEPIDDVPPGFGPGAASHDDDLPEFDFVHSSTQMSAPPPPQAPGLCMNHPSVLPPARPVEQMRELINKYGQSENASKPILEIQPWDDEEDDDDIPEWQPYHDNQPQAQPSPLPPPPPPLQMHGYQQQTVQPFAVNQHFVPGPPLPLPPGPSQQLVPLPMPLQPQMGLMSGPRNMHPGWQPAPWWHPVHGSTDVGLPFNGVMQPCHVAGQPSEGGQFYGMPGPLQNGMGWRPDVPRSRGV